MNKIYLHIVNSSIGDVPIVDYLHSVLLYFVDFRRIIYAINTRIIQQKQFYVSDVNNSSKNTG